MKYLILVSFLFSASVCFSQPVTQRSSDVITVMDGNLFAKNSFRPAIFLDTTAANAAVTLDSCGKLIYTFSDNSYWMRGCYPKRWMKLLRQGEGGSNISNTSLTADGNYSQNWSDNQWYVDSIAGSFLFRMGGVGNTGTRRKEFRINWGGSSFGDQIDGFNILASVKKGDNSGDSLTMGVMSSGTGTFSVGTFNTVTSSQNTFISFSAVSGLLNINARDSIWIKGAVPAATADSILGIEFRSSNGVSKIVKIPISAAGGTTPGITPVLTAGQVDTNKTLQFGYPIVGFFQSQQDSPTDTIWEGAPMTGYPFRGTDTAITTPRVFTFFSMRTHRYDVTQPPNVIMNVATVGTEGIGNAYMRIGGLEWNWYDNYEYHPIEMKPIGFASAIRMQSVTMNRTTGLSTWTQRATQHIFSNISDDQILNLSRGTSTLLASGTTQPTLNFLVQSTDLSNGGFTMAQEAGQCIFNWAPSSGAFQKNAHNFPYWTEIGSGRTVNSSDPEIHFKGAGRLKNNRIFQWTNGAQGYIMAMQVDTDSLLCTTIGGNPFMSNGSPVFLVKSLRNRNQKTFAVAIASNAADTFYYKIPLAFDTVGRGAVNVPDANNAIKDGLLGLTETEDWRVYGKSIVVDNTAGLNRLMTLKNTDAGNFSGPSLKFFNNAGTGGTNGYGIEFYSNNTTGGFANAMLYRNYEGGPHVFYGQSAELGRFNDGGELMIGSATDLGSSKLQVTGTIQMQDGNQGAGKVFTSDANGVGTWQIHSLTVSTSAAATLTLDNSEAYIFNGTTTTWTLPAVSGTTGRIYYIKNIGSGSITLNADSGNNEIYSSSAVNTITVTAGSAIILISNNTYWTVN